MMGCVFFHKKRQETNDTIRYISRKLDDFGGSICFKILGSVFSLTRCCVELKYTYVWQLGATPKLSKCQRVFECTTTSVVLVAAVTKTKVHADHTYLYAECQRRSAVPDDEREIDVLFACDRFCALSKSSMHEPMVGRMPFSLYQS